MRLQGIRLGTTAAALRRLGLATDDDGRVELGGVTLEPAAGAGILGLDLCGAPADGPLPLVEVAPATPVQPASRSRRGRSHPLGAVAVDHVVVLCGDVEGTIAGLGTTPRRVDRRDGTTYGFVVAETALLEFVGPSTADDRRPRLWGLALTVADLDAAAAHLGDACGEPREAVQPGRRIATVGHDQLGLGVPTVLLSPRRS